MPVTPGYSDASFDLSLPFFLHDVELRRGEPPTTLDVILQGEIARI